MLVAIEARSLTRSGGVNTYVRELTAALPVVGPEHRYAVLDHGPAHEGLLPIWLNTTVPRWLRGVQPNVVHFTKAALPQRVHYPTVVTIHDVIPLLFPQSQKILQRLLWPATLRHAAATADHILTVSEVSKSDIVQHLQVNPAKITVTPEAIDASFSHRGVGFLPEPSTAPYILYLGTIEPRKNVAALVRAFARIAELIPHTLVIAGRQYKGVNDARQAAREAKIENRIEWRDYVPAEQLPSLYAGADLFVWPSIYEGWGFPPLEAMAMGTPVIVSNGGSLPEVVGSAAEIVPFTVNTVAERIHDTAFDEALAERMRAVLADPAKQAVMRAAGLRQVQKYSWHDVARKTLAVYEKVVREK